MNTKRKAGLLGLSLLLVTGCTSPTSFSGTVNCSTTDSNGVTNCSVTKAPSATPAPTVTVTVTPSPTGTATATPTPTPTTTTPSGSLANLARIPWEGGPSYWSKFPNAHASGFDSTSLFPISVWFGRPAHTDALKAVGVNTFLAVEHNDPLSVATSKGMYVIPHDEFALNEVPSTDKRIVGHFVGDECDMGLGPCDWQKTAQENLTIWKNETAAARSKYPNLFMFGNFSKGILGTWWATGTMGGLISTVDGSSVDNYYYTSPDSRWAATQSSYWPAGQGADPNTVKRAQAYGWQIDRMRAYQSPAGNRPNWIFVETAMPYLNDTGRTTITTPQIEGASWSGIIHEARGIAYFQHNNDGINGGYSMVDSSAARRAELAKINARIQGFAPILNTQSYFWEFGAGTDTMLKAYQGSAYIFSQIDLLTQPGARTFTLPAGITGTTVEVVGENRTIAVSGGKFTDSFAAEYTTHVYKLAL
jgi:hypothetical protein